MSLAGDCSSEDTIVSIFDQLCFSFGDDDAITSTTETTVCYLEIQEYSKNVANQLHWRFQPDYVLVDCQRFAIAEAVATLACMRIQCPFVPVSCLDQHRPGRLNVVVDYLREKGKRNGTDEPHVVAITVCENDRDPILSVFHQADVHQILYLDEMGALREQLQVPNNLPTFSARNDDLMVLFTSGTTGGSPKAVVGSHAATLRRIQWFHKTFKSSARVIRKTALTFVDGVTELWCTLLDRNSVLVAIPPSTLQAEGLAAILKAEPTQLLLLPSQLGQLLLLPKCKSLQRLIISGEQASRILVEQVCDHYPTIQLINLYGQTETTGDVLYAVLTDMDKATAFQGGIVAVGKPIADSIILVNNQQELIIQGPQLSNGYLDQQQKGIPFHSFASGDLGFCKDGIFYVQGRKDDVIKLHGIWTCPIEIETAFCAHYDTPEALACFVQDEAYILCPNENICNRFSREDMHTRGNLPWNLIPKLVICHDIPISSNSGAGKASRKDARAIVQKHLEQSHGGDQAHSCSKSHPPTLSSILCDTLHLKEDQLDREKSLVELGGDSSNAITLLFQLRQVFPNAASSLTAMDLLNEDSIHELNERLTGVKGVSQKRQKTKGNASISNFSPRAPTMHGADHISFDLLACADSKPIIYNGSIYVACQGGVILKFKPSGDVQAYRHLYGWMIQADLTIEHDQLIVCAYKRTLDAGLVVALSLDLEQILWQVTLKLPVKISPQLVDNSTLWVTMGSAEQTEICRISITSGSLCREILRLPVPSMSKPVAMDDKVIYACSSWEGGLMIVDSNDKVKHILEGEVGPVIGRDLVELSDGRVLVSDSYGVLHTFDLSAMTIQSVRICSLPLTTPIIRDDGVIIVGSNSGNLYAVSGSNTVWECPCGASILGRPLYRKADGATIIRTTAGHLIIVDNQGTIVSKRRMIRGEIWGDAILSSIARDPLDQVRAFVAFGARDSRVHVIFITAL